METCEAIAQHLLTRYKFPQDQALIDEVNGFDARCGFPQAAGAVDRTTYLLFDCRTIPLTTIIVKVIIRF